jgi:hypothetical protein
MSITLTAGMRANLFALQNTAKMMELTQSRLASGKRIQTALDDPINFFAAQGHQQRADDLAFRKDAMGEAIQTIGRQQRYRGYNRFDCLCKIYRPIRSLHHGYNRESQSGHPVQYPDGPA